MKFFLYHCCGSCMRGIFKATGVSFLSLLMVACSVQEPPSAAGHFKWHEPEVEFSLITEMIPFSEGYHSLDSQAIETLEAFLQRQIKSGQRPILRIYAVSPLATDENIVDDDFLAQRQAVVAEYAAARGFQSDLLPPRAAVSDGKHGIMVEAVRYVAIPPSCPDWSGSSRQSVNNAPGSNFGCATARNLSLMVAHPRDLIHGRTLGPAQAERFRKSLESYRKGETSPVKNQSPGQ